MKNEKTKAWPMTTISLSDALRRRIAAALPALQADYPAQKLSNTGALCLLIQEAIEVREARQ